MTIPFSQQCLPRDFVETIKSAQARGEAVSGEDLLSAIELRLGPLPADLRELFPAFSIPPVRRRGRPANNRSREDFSMAELDQRYSRLLGQFQSERASSTAKNKAAPSERAYQQLATEMSRVLGGIDWPALRNKHSSWKTGHFHGSEGFVDSEDFDAEIDRLFPPHK